MSDANTVLMESIHAKYSSAIDAACKNSSVPAAFLAALVANESGGDPHAKRFERGVLAALWEVLLGRKAAYGSIGGEDLRMYVVPAQAIEVLPTAGAAAAIADLFLQRLDGLATSWGLTQIMGYHVFDFSAAVHTIDFLQTTEGNLRVALLMLSQFAGRFHLDLEADSSELLRCWNTGQPAGETYDPQYVPRALGRMKLYAGLAAASESAT